MRLLDAIIDFEKFIKLKTTLRPVFADVILDAIAERSWVPTEEALPVEDGVYLVTILNREWDRRKGEIVYGGKPEKDEFWADHAGLYDQLPDGRWVYLTQRVFHDGVWSGYDETVLAWMEMPKPYTGG